MKTKWEVDPHTDELCAWVKTREHDDWVRAGWRPQPGSQEIFLQSPVYETLYEGTRGPGKTDALLMDFAQHTGSKRFDSDGKQISGFGAEWKGILFRQSFPQLKDVVTKSKKWFFQLFPGIKFNGSDMIWTWPTGETLRLSYIQKPGDYWNYHGHEYPWIGFEELTTWATDECYTSMFSCSRSSKPSIPIKIRATTNPYGPGHNWVKDRFALPCPSDNILSLVTPEEEPPRLAVHGSLYENKILLHADPKYVSRIVAATQGNEGKKAAWIDGSWDITSGGMFDDLWNKDIHVISKFEIPPTWRIDRSFDWGSAKPFSVGWYAQSDGTDYQDSEGNWHSTVKGDLFRIDEWYGWTGKPNEGLRMTADDIAKGMIERELRLRIHHRCKVGVADSAIFQVENGNSVGVDMQRPHRMPDGMKYRIRVVGADKRKYSRVNGWELCRQYLQNARPNENGEPRERPGFYVFSHCHQFLRTVPSIPRDENNPDDVNTEVEDHIADEWRYRVRYMGQQVTSGRTTGV